MLQALVSLALASVLAQGAPVVPLGDLAVVKSLYAAASYEEALTHLAQLDPAATTAELAAVSGAVPARPWSHGRRGSRV